MKRICVLGNSHAACFMAAWHAMSAEYQDIVDVRFFVLGGYELGKLARDGSRLVVAEQALREQLKNASGGFDEILPEDYDVFAIVSLTFGYRNLTELFSAYSTLDISRGRDGVNYLSNSCMNDCVDEILENSIGVRIRKLIGSVTEKPVIHFPAPCQSETALLEKERQFLPLKATGELARFYSKFVERSSAQALKHGSTIVYQDDATMIAGGGYTLEQYSSGAVNSSMQLVGPSDTSHMNADFGRLALNRIFSAAFGL
jgi:hypothetical protein